jgi:hypothetical protein
MSIVVFYINSYCTKYPSIRCLKASNLAYRKVEMFIKLIIIQSNFIFAAEFMFLFTIILLYRWQNCNPHNNVQFYYLILFGYSTYSTKNVKNKMDR